MDLKVRPQHKMLWDEDLGPETDVDNPEVPRDSRPESSQGEVVDGSSDSSEEEEEEEWKYVKGATKPEAKKEMSDQLSDNKSQLNPNASEFIPGVEKVSAIDQEDFIAESPNVLKASGNNLDDVDVPSETEFDLDISTRACDLEPAADDFCSALVSGISENAQASDIKNEGISLILTPQKSDPFQFSKVDKADTNPFASDMDSKTGDAEKVDFVPDYFGKSGLDFKPFESINPQDSVGDSVFDSHGLPESHTSNSVSVEISSHFNFINSHLDSNEQVRPEESEKERNQLEVKEPESPAHSEKCGNVLVDQADNQDDVDFLGGRSEVEISSVVTVTKDSGLQGVAEFVCNISEKMSEPGILCYSRDDECRVTVDNEAVLDIRNSLPKSTKSSDLEGEKCLSGIKVDKTNTGGSPFKSDFAVEASNENPRLDLGSEVIDAMEELHLESSAAQLNVLEEQNNVIINLSQGNKELSIDKEIEDKGNTLITLSNAHIDLFSEGDDSSTNITLTSHLASGVNNVTSGKESVKVLDTNDAFGLKTHNIECENKNIDTYAEGNKAESKMSFIDVESNKGFKEVVQPQLELADTIGPNSFSFSQNYEDINVHGMSALNSFKKYDVMTTSMHESFEQESSFEFISNSAVDKKNSNEKIPAPSATVPETTFERELENGLDHKEFLPGVLNGSINVDSLVENSETESAIVESHEVPVSSEPDIVFVEQICPTVEVRSDEASPVNKESSFLEMTTAAGLATALGAIIVADQCKPEPKETKSADSKTSSKPTAVKAAAGIKKPASPASKAPVSKSTVKESLSKPAPSTTKPKLPSAPKSANAGSSLAARTKPSTLTARPPTTASKTQAAKPLTKASAAPITRVPPKPAASAAMSAKPSITAAKTTTRPSSAPTKTATSLSKPSAPSKTLSSTTRAPTTVRKLPATSAKPAVASKTISAESKVSSKPPSRTVSAPTTKPSTLKTFNTAGARPPIKLGSQTAPSNKPKATSPTKPAPIKAKSPLSVPKRPISSVKKASPVLDKNAKNAVKSVPKNAAQKEIIASETQHVQEDLSATTTNGHHIENGNVTPIEEIPSHII